MGLSDNMMNDGLSKNEILERLKKIRKSKDSSIEYHLGSEEEKIEPFSTGLKEIDEELIGGIGGFPRGRITQISGLQSAGKSYFIYYVIARAQERGEIAALMNPEKAYQSDWGENFGIDNDKLILSEFNSMEDCYDSIISLLYNFPEIGIIAVDSTDMLMPKQYIGNKDVDPNKINWEVAKLNKMKIRELLMGAKPYGTSDLVKLYKTKCALVFISHLKEKASGGYGAQYYSGGGTAIAFWAHLRLNMFPLGFGKERDQLGNPVQQISLFKTDKSRLSVPQRKVKVILDWSGGIEILGSGVIYQIALNKNLLDISGSWITMKYGDEEIKIQGKDNFVKLVEEERPEIKDWILEYDDFMIKEKNEKERQDGDDSESDSGFDG